MTNKTDQALKAGSASLEADQVLARIRDSELIRSWTYKTGSMYIDQVPQEIEIQLYDPLQRDRSRWTHNQVSWILLENKKPVFWGLGDLGVPSHVCIDEDRTIIELLFFLTLEEMERDHSEIVELSEIQHDWISSQSRDELNELTRICEESDLTLEAGSDYMRSWS